MDWRQPGTTDIHSISTSVIDCPALERNMVKWPWWDSSLICKTNWIPSVLWHCWFDHIQPNIHCLSICNCRMCDRLSVSIWIMHIREIDAMECDCLTKNYQFEFLLSVLVAHCGAQDLSIRGYWIRCVDVNGIYPLETDFLDGQDGLTVSFIMWPLLALKFRPYGRRKPGVVVKKKWRMLKLKQSVGNISNASFFIEKSGECCPSPPCPCPSAPLIEMYYYYVI